MTDATDFKYGGTASTFYLACYAFELLQGSLKRHNLWGA